MKLDELYQEVILDHFKHPRCKGCPAGAGCCANLFNPLCGDRISLGLTLKDGVVSDIGFSGQGCSISQAAASMMTDICRGKSVDDVQTILSTFRAMMRGEIEAEQCTVLGDAVALEGVRRFSARVKCAMLACEAVEKCFQDAGLPLPASA